MKKTYQEWLTEKADIIIKVGKKVKDTNEALIQAAECNDQTGLQILIVDEKGKGVYFMDEDGYVEWLC